jgi:tricorn protease
VRFRTPALLCVLTTLLTFFVATPAPAEESRLLRHPDVSDRQIVFAHGGDLFIVDRDGGAARRLTSHPGIESFPRFSPDGTWIAFSAQYDGNTDVFIVPVEGGEPRRLTWHPDVDTARGWSNDGRRVIFASGRTNPPIQYPKFWTIGVDGGMPESMPMPRAWRGQHSPDGRRFVYELVQSYETEWRNYRGGQNKPIFILDLDSLALEKLPWDGANDSDPVYLGDTIYFLSDRDYTVNVHAFANGAVRQLTRFTEFDCKNLESGGGRLVFENGGFIHLLDPAGGEPRRVPIAVRGDFPWARPHWEDVAAQLSNGSLSPTGKRALFEARGEIFTVPAKKGAVRNLTQSSGVADRAPAWSPDGTRIAWFSDEGGEYGLVIADQDGANRRAIELDRPTFFYTPAWSPDSNYIAFADADRTLWVADLQAGKVRRIDNEGFTHPLRTIYPEWSPDSKWIAYTKRLTNQFNAIRVYSIESGESHPVSDGMSDSLAPAWDRSGKYLYFLASTSYGMSVGWLDMSSFDRPRERSIYLAVLAADEPSPLLPESDDEEIGKKEENGDDKTGEGGDAAGGKAPEVRIDFDGLQQRIIALGTPARDYYDLEAGADGTLFYSEGDPPLANSAPARPPSNLYRYTLKEREEKKVMTGVTWYALSADGSKLLYQANGGWEIVDAAAEAAPGEAQPGDGALDTADIRMKVDPAAEWTQMFREAWRYQRDYFYVDNVHGLDLGQAYARYAPWVDHVRHRDDLTHLLDILGGETSVGHSFTAGGDSPDIDTVPVGLLGADLEVDGDRYRIGVIYDGESWNPDLRAPLRGPGIEVNEGDYLLAVNGRELKAGMNPYSLFDRTADRQTAIKVNDRPQLEGARELTVVPVASEAALRTRAWVEGNRRKVDELSDGKLAYVWIPDTGQNGYVAFNRYYFAQQDKQGAVIDERFNQGGAIADYMVDLMSRTLMGYFNNPIGDRQPFTAPNAGIWGPKVMLINDAAGSGGDMLPYMFSLRQIGPLIGTRTWGGLVGIWDVPPLIDGGFITSPRGGFFDLDGEWAVENYGVPPDIEVEQLPAEVNAGRDPQLEKGVEVALEMLRKQGIELKKQPPDPVRVRRAK